MSKTSSSPIVFYSLLLKTLPQPFNVFKDKALATNGLVSSSLGTPHSQFPEQVQR